MRKVICLLALSAGIGVMTLPEVPTADAQVKAKTADPKTKAKAVTGTIEVYKGKDGYRFRIKDGDKVLAISSGRGVETKEEVHTKLETIKEILNNSKITDVKEAKE